MDSSAEPDVPVLLPSAATSAEPTAQAPLDAESSDDSSAGSPEVATYDEFEEPQLASCNDSFSMPSGNNGNSEQGLELDDLAFQTPASDEPDKEDAVQEPVEQFSVGEGHQSDLELATEASLTELADATERPVENVGTQDPSVKELSFTQLLKSGGPAPAVASSSEILEASEGPTPAACSPSEADQQEGNTTDIQSGMLRLNSFEGFSRQLNLHKNEDDTVDSWHAHKKHFFVLTSSGKPVYSRYGDECALAGFMALVQALISVVQDQGDQIRFITAGKTVIVFLIRGPLYFVATSSLGEPVLVLHHQLALLFGQVEFMVTTSLQRALQRNPAYDARGLLEGNFDTFHALISHFSHNPCYLFSAFEPMPMPCTERARATAALADAVKSSGAYYGLLFSQDLLVAMERQKGQPALVPEDVLLMTNFITSHDNYKVADGEFFSPMCLPHFNSDAFLHAYITYLDLEAGLYLVLLSGTSDSFHKLSDSRKVFERVLRQAGVLQQLREIILHPGRGRLRLEQIPGPLGGKLGSTAVRHFLCRMPQKRQVVMCDFSTPNESEEARKELVRSYAFLFGLVHDQPLGTQPYKMAWHLDCRRAVIAELGREFEVYMVLDPLAEKTVAVAMCEVLRSFLGDKARQADMLLAHV